MSDTAKNYTLESHPAYGYLEVKPTPSQEEVSRYYAEEFYSSEYPRLNDSGLAVQQRDAAYFDQCRAEYCEHIERILGTEVGGLAVLDIGCGFGETLAYLRDRGADVYGFDPAVEAVEYAASQGLNVVQASMDDFDVFGRRFDVVLMQNVLEHLADPEAVIRQVAAKLLAPGGLLLIDVPNEFNDFQLAGQAVHDLDQWWVCPPVHLNYFSHASLAALVEGCGFSVAHLSSSFPIEIFLLFGDQYVGDGELGRACHERRMAFETNLRSRGRPGPAGGVQSGHGRTGPGPADSAVCGQELK